MVDTDDTKIRAETNRLANRVYTRWSRSTAGSEAREAWTEAKRQMALAQRALDEAMRIETRQVLTAFSRAMDSKKTRYTAQRADGATCGHRHADYAIAAQCGRASFDSMAAWEIVKS